MGIPMGKHKLREAFCTEVCKYLFEPSITTCRSSEQCAAMKHTFLSTPAWSNIVWNDQTDVLDKCTSMFIRTRLEVLCLACKHELHASMAQGRLGLWAKLPVFFGLPTWEVLQAEGLPVPVPPIVIAAA